MAYNKTAHLRRNIDALRTAFALEREQRTATPEERETMRVYNGFGAIKEILEPLPHKKPTALTPLIEELHALLKENLPDREAARYFEGIKASVLTAFYTPGPVMDAVMVLCGIPAAACIGYWTPAPGRASSSKASVTMSKRRRLPASRKTLRQACSCGICIRRLMCTPKDTSVSTPLMRDISILP